MNKEYKVLLDHKAHEGNLAHKEYLDHKEYLVYVVNMVLKET